MSSQSKVVDVGDYKYGFNYPDTSVYRTLEKGLTEEVVRAISEHKKEPEWMLEFRLQSLKEFHRKEMPNWGADLSSLNFDEMYYYATAVNKQEKRWEDLAVRNP